ncbi:MAG: hypothetical protein MPJ08_04120 [Nitrosopumilus sp.]|nr:hypothetical protein [Nitrosopumilus sp.]
MALAGPGRPRDAGEAYRAIAGLGRIIAGMPRSRRLTGPMLRRRDPKLVMSLVTSLGMDIGVIVKQAYAPRANRLSMIVEIERIRLAKRRPPDAAEVDRHSRFLVESYEAEFGSVEDLLENLGYGGEREDGDDGRDPEEVVRGALAGTELLGIFERLSSELPRCGKRYVRDAIDGLAD